MNLIEDSLKEMSATAQVNAQVTAQVHALLEAIGDGELSSNELMEKLQLRHVRILESCTFYPRLKPGWLK